MPAPSTPDKQQRTQVIRVLLADDHAVVRRGIRDFLSETDDIKVIAEAGDGQQALLLAAEYSPDVVVLDVQMPNGNGIEVAHRLKNSRASNTDNATVGVLMLTAFDDPPYVRAALEAGANGYLLKSAEPDEIIAAVRAVNEGKQVFDSYTHLKNKTALIAFTSGSANNDTVALSQREHEVLRLAAHGLTNKAIGFQLSISDRTVQGHLANVYEKLSVSGRTEAVTRAIELRLLNTLT